MLGLERPKGTDWLWVAYAVLLGGWNLVALIGNIKKADYMWALIEVAAIAFVLTITYLSLHESKHHRERMARIDKQHEEFMENVRRLREDK